MTTPEDTLRQAAEHAMKVLPSALAEITADDLLEHADYVEGGGRAQPSRVQCAEEVLALPVPAVSPAPDTDLRARIAAVLARLDAEQWGSDHGFAERYGADAETDSFVDALAALFEREHGEAVVRQAVLREERDVAKREHLEFARQQSEGLRAFRAELHARLGVQGPPQDCKPVLDAVAEVVAERDKLRAEVERLHQEIQAHQVSEGYERGHEHGVQAGLAAAARSAPAADPAPAPAAPAADLAGLAARDNAAHPTLTQHHVTIGRPRTGDPQWVATCDTCRWTTVGPQDQVEDAADQHRADTLRTTTAKES